MIEYRDTPLTESIGDVVENSITWDSDLSYDDKGEFLGVVESITHYVANFNGSYHIVPVGTCRLCGKPVDSYSESYYQVHYENDSCYSIQYNAALYFCRACAQAESKKVYVHNKLAPLKKRYETYDTHGRLIEVKVYADGTRVEG